MPAQETSTLNETSHSVRCYVDLRRPVKRIWILHPEPVKSFEMEIEDLEDQSEASGARTCRERKPWGTQETFM
jgi:hypothetical protein